MELSNDVPASERKLEARKGQKSRTRIEPDDHERLRRAGEEMISQHLYSIILAIHTAEASLVKNPGRLPAILGLIHTQSEACLDELRRLATLR
jgi:hypothetical protein